MQNTLFEASSTTESSRIIVSQVLNLERTAGQYWVLREPELLQRYQDQRQQLLESIEVFYNNVLTPTILKRMAQLTTAEKKLHEKLLIAPKKPDDTTDLKNLSDLSALVSDLPQEVNNSVNIKSQATSKSIYRVKRLLLIQVLVLIPLALIMQLCSVC